MKLGVDVDEVAHQLHEKYWLGFDFAGKLWTLKFDQTFMILSPTPLL